MIINDYYDSLPTNEQKRKFKEDVLQETGMTESSFYWKRRFNKWKKGDIILITRLIEKNDYAKQD